MHQLESYGNDIYLFTHKKPFVNNTYDIEQTYVKREEN